MSADLFDISDPAFRDDPYPAFARQRAEAHAAAGLMAGTTPKEQ